jgi:hypothetical protein
MCNNVFEANQTAGGCGESWVCTAWYLKRIEGDATKCNDDAIEEPGSNCFDRSVNSLVVGGTNYYHLGARVSALQTGYLGAVRGSSRLNRCQPHFLAPHSSTSNLRLAYDPRIPRKRCYKPTFQY